MHIRFFKPIFALLLTTCLSTPTLGSNTLRVGGTATGISTKNNDDIVDAAIVLTTLRPRDIVNFDLSKLLGPNEPMRAGPSTIQVPGNLFVPSQKEKWGIWSVVLEKAQFGLYVNSQQKEEVFASWVKAPFSTMVDMGQSGGGFNKILPQLKLHAYAFEEEKDWSRELNLNIRVTKPYSPAMNYTWVRPTLPSDSADMVLNFQMTPQKRWMLTDLVGTAPQAGRVYSASELAPTFKTFFSRLKFNEQGNTVKISTLIQNSSSAQDSIKISGLASDISGAKTEGNRVVWEPIQSPGWMLVLHHNKKIRVSTQTFIPAFALENLSFGLRSLAEGQNDIWVDPRLGSLDLNGPLGATDTVTLIFVGTEKDVIRPDLDLQEEPEVFTYAKEFRMLVLK